jgi:hypothetical protein
MYWDMDLFSERVKFVKYFPGYEKSDLCSVYGESRQFFHYYL